MISALTAKKNVYRPLDVPSWGDGFRVIIGWLLMILFAVVSGGLFVLYELEYINVADTDVRDMDYDFRITSASTTFYHKYFINGQVCCNQDSTVYASSVISSCNNQYQQLQYSAYSASQTPTCPPIVYYQCSNLNDADCDQAASSNSLYLYLSNANSYGNPSGNYIGTPFQYNNISIYTPSGVAAIQSWISNVASVYGSAAFAQPAKPLSTMVLVDGLPANLDFQELQGDNGNIVAIGYWRKAQLIWDFPGLSKACPNTGNQPQYGLTGSVPGYIVPEYDVTSQGDLVSTITFFNDTIQFSPWQVKLVDQGSTAQEPSLNTISVSSVTSVQISVGMVAALGPCYGWLIDHTQSSVIVTYGPPSYYGPASGLLAASLPSRQTQLYFTVLDVSRPEQIQLPQYGGMWYIVAAFAASAVFSILTVPLILIGLPIIWWNVRANQGKPLVYRYLRSYRGW
ncbi:hypothetical protein CEUSTIGMA_g9142.t1 [Chlamydomonas eustigma]|uniref:Uncharacterized protein n=1 Tax=Chlamydomonas eustigma TaxID=1157962 RepID=A0A250XF48_9CHLO|nr:hypothetical protein CEUSTIGMA_g9142.t1 [Chlamydomonas eustigma]|eukprot:GAX81714.1 hypothetical protein CEUSTIGMA_g9142.t1 [Chlamydomonas eustigma]